MNYRNIYTLFRDRVATFKPQSGHTGSGRNAFYVRRSNTWVGISWQQFEESTLAFASALLSYQLQPGASVCILMGNVPEWPIADIATIIAGGVGVGLYPTSSAEQCQYIIAHSDAEFVFVDTATQLQKVLSIRSGLPKLKKIIVLDLPGRDIASDVIGYSEFLREGELNLEKFEGLIRDRGASADPGETAIIVYTSGTTGLPKGACLSHRYIINSVESLRETIPIYDSDSCFSYLPFCHVAERISGLYNRLYAGTPAHFVDDIARLGEYMLEVKPTVFASLPRFFEKIHARAMADIERLPKKERERFHAALDIGRKVVELKQTKADVPPELESAYTTGALPTLERLKEYFGGRLRLATSGGAPLPLEIAEFFAAAGIPILQAYGLTENICVSFNRADNYKFGTVGPPMPGCEVRIADDGEILVRSAMMFSGYYKEPETTAEVIKEDWLQTGDLGELDEDGFLRITGRKKELIVTSTGKKIAPAPIENLIREHHLISHAMVFGEGKSYLVVLITLNQVEAQGFATAQGIGFADFAELTTSPQIRLVVQQLIDRVNSRVSSTESIRKFVILEKDFEIEADEVTPTMKLKRENVTARLQSVLDALYATNP
jgi:long-chain acyl-CoA synthetase